jgi:hypothetical protein
MEERETAAAAELQDLWRSIRTIEDHTGRTRYVMENDVVQLLRGIYDQVHATRHVLERLVSMMEGGRQA